MPLVAWTAIAYATGLLAGFTLGDRHALLAAIALTVLATCAMLARRPRLCALAAVAAGATFIAIADARRDAACARTIASAHAWEFRLTAAAAEGDVARGEIETGGCVRRATVLVATGQGMPGERLEVSGEASVGDRSVLVQDATLVSLGRDAILTRLRASAAGRIDRLFGADAPIVRALVVADMGAIRPEQRDRYADAGLVHMLSVSGLHVGIVALALQLLGSALRLPRIPVQVGTLVLLALYVAAIGAPPPAVRAAVMLGVVLAARLQQRPTSRWAILALGATAPLVVPRVVLDLGWQLSVAGTAALVSGGALASRLVPVTWRGHRRTLAAGAVISIVATVVTAPLVAWSFGRVSLVGPLTNLLADPVMGLLQPLLFVALLVPVHAIERVCADAAHLLIALFDAIARGGAAIPGAAPAVAPTTVGAVLTGVAAIAVLVACCARHPARAMLVGVVALALLVVAPALTPPAAATELHLIDVGQGDAIALRTRAGRWIVVDAGRSWLGGDAGRTTVAPYLAHRGGPIALFVLSHPHADHVGGAASLFKAIHPLRFLDPGFVGTSPPYLAALAEAARERIPWQRVRPGDSLVVDEVSLTALAPDSAWAATLGDANLASTVLVARVGGVRMLLTGDAEEPEERWLLDRAAAALHADILKVAHHGSGTSTSPDFLDAVRPRLALVSVGAHNTYGHPDAAVMERLHAAGAQVLRTDRMGTVVVRTDGHTISVEARGERWTIPERVPERVP